MKSFFDGVRRHIGNMDAEHLREQGVYRCCIAFFSASDRDVRHVLPPVRIKKRQTRKDLPLVGVARVELAAS